ncbi:MAG TPA: BON domain-containing protein [Thermodesulfobacteriota bacterium]
MTEHTSKNPIKAIKALLTDELHIDPVLFPIEVAQENGSILIEGTVEKISQKKRALLFAMGLEGISGIIDRLRVRPSVRMTDAEIRKHLYDAFTGEGALTGLKIEAEVKDGVVDLEGEVWSLSHKRLAGALAWWVPGSIDVINSIEVVPSESDSDDEVSDAVRLILEKDRLVDAASLRISTRDWIVTLEGVAGSNAEREAAEDDAWFTWGVNGVVNNIIVDRTSIHKLP